MMKDDEGWWRMNEEWWRMMILSCWGVLVTDRITDICDCRVAFATEKCCSQQCCWKCLSNFFYFGILPSNILMIFKTVPLGGHFHNWSKLITKIINVTKWNGFWFTIVVAWSTIRWSENNSINLIDTLFLIMSLFEISLQYQLEIFKNQQAPPMISRVLTDSSVLFWNWISYYTDKAIFHCWLG